MSIRSLYFLVPILLSGVQTHAAECPVTIPNLDSPSGALKESTSHGWYGSSELAALVPVDGKWVGMGSDNDFRDKFWWWYKGFNANIKSEHKLSISGRRLDREAPPLVITETTSGYGKDWDSMLALVEFPSAGCWELVGTYGNRQLKVVFQVGEP